MATVLSASPRLAMDTVATEAGVCQKFGCLDRNAYGALSGFDELVHPQEFDPPWEKRQWRKGSSLQNSESDVPLTQPSIFMQSCRR